MPKIIGNVFISGNVTFGEKVTLFHGASLRGDLGTISIGNYSNIQDNCSIHCAPNLNTVIGNYVTVGHNAVVHSANIGDNTVIGMGSIILNNAVVGKNCIVGAGTLIGQGKVIPDNSIVIGNPFRFLRSTTEDDIVRNRQNALEYVDLGENYYK